ncbi:hypothetical protein Ngar_c23700 [Candidatus Nitrososphaera gargensis Ga9.2]|uniref:Uncharacterized protein n=1 Tax=Nitrososphaera gargensis (strain Ga9.2) TaxID=1237085 RepID=K0IHA5_NITGG|nr:hypothetical protein [Candidatus Nitrososphaera gargensis]AFU59295.1 hypothetical protein Ngar_c23700 [Candidatus Nitrososphaera gargensis Ga9.2]
MAIIKEFRKKKFKNIVIISGGITAFSDRDTQNNLVAYEQAILETVKKNRVGSGNLLLFAGIVRQDAI